MEVTHTRIEVPLVHWNFSPFGLIFTAKKFLEAARPVILQEKSSTEGKWHPVGKYLVCHSIELSLKAFLTLDGDKMDSVKQRYSHRIAKLLADTEKRNLGAMVKLADEERAEIRKSENYYNGKVFEYPAASEVLQSYPRDPDIDPLLSAAEKLVEGLYHPCREA